MIASSCCRATSTSPKTRCHEKKITYSFSTFLHFCYALCVCCNIEIQDSCHTPINGEVFLCLRYPPINPPIHLCAAATAAAAVAAAVAVAVAVELNCSVHNLTYLLQRFHVCEDKILRGLDSCEDFTHHCRYSNSSLTLCKRFE